jgi:hypothetical protein
MEPKSSEKIVLAVVGHCDPLFLNQIKQTIQNIPHFKSIFFKTSYQKLFIFGEGEMGNDR